MSSFYFQQFSIQQDACAMKVGTDGVLLGSWAKGGKKLLDVGTGTGLLALMMAQRYPQAKVQAIEIEPAAAAQAQANFVASLFAPRLQLFTGPVQAFPQQHFEAIVCNPPYFPHNQQIESSKRRLARQDSQLDFPTLAAEVHRLLGPSGKASFIIPAAREIDFQKACLKQALYLGRRCAVHSRADKPVKRVLVEYRKEEIAVEQEKLLLHEGEGYSEDFKKRTAAFYL